MNHVGVNVLCAARPGYNWEYDFSSSGTVRQNFINGYVFEFSMFMKVINEYGHGFASITL